MEPVKRLVDSFGVEDVTQAEQETIEIFCRVLSRELTRSTGHKIDIRPESLSGYSEEPGKISKNQKRTTYPKPNPEKRKS